MPLTPESATSEILTCGCGLCAEIRRKLAIAGDSLPAGAVRSGRVVLSVTFVAHSVAEYKPADADVTPVDRPRRPLLSIGTPEIKMVATVTEPAPVRRGG